MQIWTGKFCLVLSMVGLVYLTGCSHSSDHPASSSEVPPVVSFKSDRAYLDELRKEIPEETKQSNDRLAEMLKRWMEVKTDPEKLRERFSAEINKMRVEFEKRIKRARDDFQKNLTDARNEFQRRQKDERDDYLTSHPPQDKRKRFMDDQGAMRDRFQADQKDARYDFEETIKDQRKTMESEIANRWSEWRTEYPQYSRAYREMKAEEDKQKDARRYASPTPYAGWPYAPGGAGGASGAAAGNTGNSVRPTPSSTGSDGWPKADPNEFDQLGH